MKKITVEVKSKKEVIGTVEVPQFENMAEAVKALTEEKALALINRQHQADLTNQFRAEKTRTTSPMAALNKLAKTNPEIQKAIEGLIKKYATA